MSTDDRNDGFDELLRRSMDDEAETIVPAGNGLSRIQQRVAARRARLRWLRPSLALGSAVVVAALVVGGVSIANRNGNTAHLGPDTSSGTPTPSQTDTPTPSETPTNAPISNVTFPTHGFFPFTNAVDEVAWERNDYAQGHMPWIADPSSVATYWVQNYLGYSTVDQVVQTSVAADNGSADVTLGFKPTAGSTAVHPVTTVHLVRMRHAWIVTGAKDPQGNLAITTPRAGTLATSPLTVKGPAYGVDEAAEVDVVDATSPTSFGIGHTGSFGAGSPTWSASVKFSQPTGPVGVLVVVNHGNADLGGPQALTAEQLTFGEASGASYPPYFYAIKDSKVTRFASSSGASIEYLTSDTSGGGASDPQVSDTGEQIYYIQGANSCANSLMSVTTGSGHATSTVATPDGGYVIAGYAVGPAPAAASGGANSARALYETACDSARSPEAKLVLTATDGSHRTINYPSVPPRIIGDPSFEPGTTDPGNVRWLDAFVKTGTHGYLAKYDVTNDTSPTPARNACPAYDVNNGMPQAVEVTGAGELWFAVQTGSSMQVWHCSDGHAATAFTVPGNDTPADVDVTTEGQAVLLTDISGKVWRWDSSGTLTELSPHQPLTQVTW